MPKPSQGEVREMAAGGGHALSEPLEGEDAQSWYKCYEDCVTANSWMYNQKKLLSRGAHISWHTKLKCDDQIGVNTHF